MTDRTKENNPVHTLPAREKTEARGVRLPVSLWRMLEAVQSREGDTFLNQTLERHLGRMARERLAA